MYALKIIIVRLHYFYKTIPDAGTLLTQVYAIDVALALRMHATIPTREVAPRA